MVIPVLKLVLYGVAIVATLIAAHNARQFRSRMERPTSGKCCIACDGSQLRTTAPGAYECLQCGYEGGPGFAAFVQARAGAALAGQCPESREGAARQRLRDALHTLMGASADGRDVDEVALRAAHDLDEAARLGAGCIMLAGHGAFDPRVVAGQLKADAATQDTPFLDDCPDRLGRVRRSIAAARVVLELTLKGAPAEVPSSRSPRAGYR